MIYNPFLKPQFEETGITRVMKVTSLQDMINLEIIKPEQVQEAENTCDPNMIYDDEM